MILKKPLYWAALALFAYMPFHIFVSQWASTFTGGIEVWKIAKDVVTAVLVSVLVLLVVFDKKYTRQYLYFLGFAVAYLVLHLVSLVATDQPVNIGLLATLYNNRLVWYLLIGYSLVLLFPKYVKPGLFIKILLITSTIVCVFGIVQRYLPADIMTHFGYGVERGTKPNFFIDDKPDLPRIFSTIRDPNSLAAFLLLPIAVITTLLVIKWRDQKRTLLTGLLLLHILALFLTFSRSGLIGLFITLLIVLGYLLRKTLIVYTRRYSILIVGVLILVTVVFVSQKDQYIIQNVVFHADESTTLDDPQELRIGFLQRGLNGIADNPEGNGPGTAGLVSTRLPSGGLLTENYYVQIAYEVGVLGVLLFLTFIGYVGRLLLVRIKEPMALALLASFVGLACMSLLFHVWSNEAIAAGWFMVAGFVLAGRPNSASKSKL